MARPRLQETKSQRWMEVEKEYGLPMAEILPRAFALYGGREATAKGLRINAVTLDRWLRACNLRPEYDLRTKVVPITQSSEASVG